MRLCFFILHLIFCHFRFLFSLEQHYGIFQMMDNKYHNNVVFKYCGTANLKPAGYRKTILHCYTLSETGLMNISVSLQNVIAAQPLKRKKLTLADLFKSQSYFKRIYSNEIICKQESEITPIKMQLQFCRSCSNHFVKVYYVSCF